MKPYIVLIATIVLGVFIFTLVAGPGDDSLTRTAGSALLHAARKDITP
jgi:hypothetical protein